MIFSIRTGAADDKCEKRLWDTAATALENDAIADWTSAMLRDMKQKVAKAKTPGEVQALHVITRFQGESIGTNARKAARSKETGEDS